KVQKEAANEYTLTDPDGDTATVNTESDVLSSDRIFDFTSVSSEESDNLSDDTDEIAPFLKSQSEVTIEPAKPVSLSFADYGIDIIGDTDDIWLPFETASNLFICFYGATMYYNGVSIFRSISLADVEYLYGKKWTKEYDSLYPDGVRPVDLADYCYREMTFLFDTQWGNPGRCYFADAIREKGMDRALSETDDVTRAVQKLLKSTSLKDYMIGLGIMNDMLFDGGHTSLTYILDPYMALTGTTLETVYAKYCTDMEAVADKIGYQMKNLTDDYWQANYDVTESRGWSGYSYHEQGDTAIFSFDAFEADSDAWKEYYKNGGELPNDTYGNFIKYLNKATESGTIKNFVLDLTANAGGQTSVYCAMFALMGYPSDSYFKQVKTGCLYKYQLEIDRNLDGKFDEADNAVKYPFHYAILTSRASYSSGNIMPFLAKGYGIMTLGEASRGGGFAETLTSSPDGLVWFYSGPINITDKDGRSADPSVEPDKAIEVKTDADGYPDYSSFYDIPALSGYINEFYNKK
ncbi:MAG: hypothetical protein J5819_02835, partial [Eubacterium sp.]|nr:hypothetical protein [Eubacterium sp.]